MMRDVWIDEQGAVRVHRPEILDDERPAFVRWIGHPHAVAPSTARVLGGPLLGPDDHCLECGHPRSSHDHERGHCRATAARRGLSRRVCRCRRFVAQLEASA